MCVSVCLKKWRWSPSRFRFLPSWEDQNSHVMFTFLWQDTHIARLYPRQGFTKDERDEPIIFCALEQVHLNLKWISAHWLDLSVNSNAVLLGISPEWFYKSAVIHVRLICVFLTCFLFGKKRKKQKTDETGTAARISRNHHNLITEHYCCLFHTFLWQNGYR